MSKVACPKRAAPLLHGLKGNRIGGPISFFPGGMDSGKDTDGVVVCGKDTGLCDMEAFLIYIFGRSTFGAIPDRTEGFKLGTVRFSNVCSTILKLVKSVPLSVTSWTYRQKDQWPFTLAWFSWKAQGGFADLLQQYQHRFRCIQNIHSNLCYGCGIWAWYSDRAYYR